jgi:hypothetical protein
VFTTAFTGPYPEANEFSPHVTQYSVKILFNIILRLFEGVPSGPFS